MSAILDPPPSRPATPNLPRRGQPQSRRPCLMVAVDQAGAVHADCDLLRQSEHTVNTVFETGDALARVLREETRHHLLVTGSGEGAQAPEVPAADLVVHLREFGYRGCIHLRSGFITPEELGVYQRAGIAYVLTPKVGRSSFLDDVQALTDAAPADAACLSILQLDA